MTAHRLSQALLLTLALLLSHSLLAQTGREWYDKAQNADDPLVQVEYYTKAINAGYKDNWVYYGRAWSYYESEKYGKALRDFTEATTAPGTIDQSYVSCGMAWTYYRLEDYSNAAKWAAKGRTQKASLADNWNISGWAEFSQGNYTKAAEYFSELIRLQPGKAIGYTNRAETYVRLGLYDKVLADCEKGLGIDPSDEWLLNSKALALLKLGRKQEAFKLLGDKLQFKEDDPKSLSAVGNLYYQAGDYSTAIEFHTQGILLYEKKVKEDPKFIQVYKEDVYDIYLNRGSCQYQKKEYQHALQDYSKATLIKPEDHRAWLEIGELQTQQKNWLEATHGFEKAFAIKPSLPYGWVNLGFCYGQLNQPQKSIDAYTRGIAANPTIGLLYNNRGYTYLELKQYDKSLPDLQKAIEVEPEEVMSHVSLGEFYYYARKDYAKAIAKFDESIKMEDGSMEAYRTAYYTRGYCYYDQKMWEKAEADFREAVDTDPSHSKSWEGLAKAHYEQKEYCDAYIAAKKATDLDANKPEREAKEAPLLLAKLTTNPCK